MGVHVKVASMRGIARRILSCIGRLRPDESLIKPDESLINRVEWAERRISELSLVTSPPSSGGTYCALSGDDTQIEVYVSQFNIRWIADFGVDPKVILDIGSFDGGDGIRLKRAFPSSRVVSFEADPNRFRIVAGNVAPFGVEPVQLALSDRDGSTEWYQSHDNSFVSKGNGSQGSIFRHSEKYRLRFPHIDQTSVPISVNCGRLDTFCGRAGIDHIDLAHIDVEGAEYEVIMGMGSINPKIIFVEALSTASELWIGARDSREVHRLLSRRGYIFAGDFTSDRLYVRCDVLGDVP